MMYYCLSDKNLKTEGIGQSMNFWIESIQLKEYKQVFKDMKHKKYNQCISMEMDLYLFVYAPQR